MIANREVDDDYLAEEQPNEKQNDDTETVAEKENNVRTYKICKEIEGSRIQEKIKG